MKVILLFSNLHDQVMDIIASKCEPEYGPPLSRPLLINIPEYAAGLNVDPLRLAQKDQCIIFD